MNWALSPFTLPDAIVADQRAERSSRHAGPTAVATVGANGAVTGITITDPGSGYQERYRSTIDGFGIGAAADATIVKKGAVVAVTLVAPGFGGTGYTAPVVTFSDGTVVGHAPTAALKTRVPITNGGSGYTMPTVDSSTCRNGPVGVQAKKKVPKGERGSRPLPLDANGTDYCPSWWTTPALGIRPPRASPSTTAPCSILPGRDPRHPPQLRFRSSRSSWMLSAPTTKVRRP